MVDFDAGRQLTFDVGGGGKRKWRHLSFGDASLPLEAPPSSNKPFSMTRDLHYTSVSFEELASKPRNALPAHMVPQLLPKRYRHIGLFGKKATAGVVGSLPLLIALAAFSAPREYLTDVLTNSIRPGRWVPHDYPCGRRRLWLPILNAVC